MDDGTGELKHASPGGAASEPAEGAEIECVHTTMRLLAIRPRLFSIFRKGFGKPQRKQSTQRKQQLSVPSSSSLVNLLCRNPPIRKKLKSHIRPAIIKKIF